MTLTKEAPTSLSASEVNFPDLPVFREDDIYSIATDETFSFGDEEALRKSLNGSRPSYEIVFNGAHMFVDIIRADQEVNADTSLSYYGAPDGVTTEMYKRAFTLMNNIANILKKPVNFRFVTDKLDMKKWVLSQSRVLDWETRYIREERIEATKKIIPISTNGHHK